METPLFGRGTVVLLRYGHGLFNTMIMLLFFYQAWLGVTIRRRRLAGAPSPVAAMRRHRRLGPILTALAIGGFCAGVFLVLISGSGLFRFPLHLGTGLTIVLLVIATFLISRRIRGPAAETRTAHFTLGLAILFLYLVQTFLGLGIFL